MIRNRKTNAILWLALLACAPLLGQPLLGQSVEANEDVARAGMSAWRHLPVYHQGRVKPLDAYAKMVAQKVTEFDKSSIRLNLTDYYTAEELADPKMAAALEIFPEGKERKFQAAEILLDWLVRPEAWEHVPFIYLAHEDVRKELELPILGPGGHKLNFISPHQVETSVLLRKHLAERGRRADEAKRQEREPDETALDKKIWSDLLFRYSAFREATFDPREEVIFTEPIPLVGSRNRFAQQLFRAVELLEGGRGGDRGAPVQQLQLFMQIGSENELGRAATRTLQAYQDIRILFSGSWATSPDFLAHTKPEPLRPEDPATLEEWEPAIVEMREAVGELAEILRKQRDRFDDQLDMSRTEYENVKPIFQTLFVTMNDLRDITRELHLALYENSNVGGRFASNSGDRIGNALLVVPGLNASALASTRDVKDLSQPWMGLTSVLYGSPRLLANYDSNLVAAIRRDWGQIREAYLAEGKLEDAKDSLGTFAHNVQRLGESASTKRLEVIKEELTQEQIDAHLLAYTAYPPSRSYRLETEVRYNELDPFRWAWLISFFATIGFSLAFSSMRKPMFWIGTVFLVAAILWSSYGFFMRVVITGWAPVTNMYETVVFVPWVVCSMGLIFLLLPLFDDARLAAWRATAAPFTWEQSKLTKRQTELLGSFSWDLFNWVSIVPRLLMMVGLGYYLTMQPIYDGNRPLLNLFSFFSFMDAYGWMTGMGFYLVQLIVFVLLVWYIPRLALATLYLVYFTIADWVSDVALDKKMERTYERHYFGIAAGFCGTFFFTIASIAPILDTSFSPVLNANFSPLQPVLRSNVWLTVHVLTIVASYGAGLLAWGLGWMALGYYMFGTYRKPVLANPTDPRLAPAAGNTHHSLGYRPPEQCHVLGNYAYRAVQVAVLLLAAGTILGGIWADVSWGRFWGWDPKEVWALVSLLVYLAILHGRFAGWFNNFGLIVGTILGFSAIVGSWYGVNFLLPLFKGNEAVGLHSYGSGGAGSEIYVISFVLLNWIGLAIVGLRFQFAKLSQIDDTDADEVIVPAENLVKPEDESLTGKSSAKTKDDTEIFKAE